MVASFVTSEWVENEKRWQRYFGSEWLANSACNDNAILYYPTQTVVYPTATTVQYQLGGEQTLAWQYQFNYQNWIGQLGGMGALAVPETDAQKAERLKQRMEREAKRQAAEQRAEHLLFSILTPAQVRQYKDDQFFDVPIIDRVYRIRKGVSRNIEVIEGGKRMALLCAHPTDAYEVPVPDVMLSQLLALRANEGEFLRVANRTVLP